MAFIFLDRYVKQHNAMREAFGDGPAESQLSLTNRNDRKKIRSYLECDLSPENLCCDGELSGNRLHAKSKFLNGALRELNSIKGA